MALFSIQFGVFLTVVTIAYFLFPKGKQWICLLLSSLLYYVSGGWDALAFLMATIITTFLAGIWIENIQVRGTKAIKAQIDLDKEGKKAAKAKITSRKKRVLVATLLLNFGILAVIKYGNFTIANVNGILEAFHSEKQFQAVDFIVPLGISFYTFQSMGYLIDVYRGKVKADRNIFKFALFVSYFPQIVQGPIGRYSELAFQLEEPHNFDYQRVTSGLQRIGWGYFKKIIIAERVAIFVNEVFNNYQSENYRGLIIFLGVLLYSIQVYADFSGGMDIIIGTSEMFGITMTENFKRPFFACSVAEFWQRWHITLGGWMKVYVFYPLALSKTFTKMGKKLRTVCGNYLGKVIPTCLASFIVFFLVGIWHGADWKYVVYAFYHAILVSSATLLENPYEKIRTRLKVTSGKGAYHYVQIARTLLLVTIGRYFSRGNSLGDAWRMLKATFSTFNPWVLFDGSLYKLGLDYPNFVVMLLSILFLLFVDIKNEQGVCLRKEVSRQHIIVRWAVYYLFIVLILVFGVYGPGYDSSAFIYQKF